MPRWFRQVKKAKLSEDGTAILQAALETARRNLVAEEHARKKAEEEAIIRQRISELQEKIAESGSSAETLNLLYDECLVQAQDAKNRGNFSEADEATRTAQRHKEQLENTVDTRIEYMRNVATLNETLRQRENTDHTGRFVAVLESAIDSKSFYADNQPWRLTESTKTLRDALVQTLHDTKARIRAGVQEVEVLLEKKADLLQGAAHVHEREGSTEVKDTSNWKMVRIVEDDIDKAKVNISNLITQRDALYVSLDQKQMITCLHLFVDNAESAIAMFKSAANASDGAFQGSGTANSDEKAMDINRDITKLQTRLSILLQGTQRLLDTVGDHHGRLYTDRKKLLIEASNHKAQGQSERLHLTLMLVKGAKKRLKALETQRLFLEEQNTSVYMICVLLDVFRSRRDMQLVLAMTAAPCTEADETNNLNGGAELHERRRLMGSIRDNDRMLSELSQTMVELEMKRKAVLTEALALTKANNSAMEARQKARTAHLTKKQKHLRTEQYVRVMSEGCCLEQQTEERYLAWMFQKLKTEANKLSANDASGNVDDVAEQVEGIESANTNANKAIEAEIERMTRMKRFLEKAKGQMHKEMLRRPGFDGVETTAHYTIQSKKFDWYCNTMKRLEDHIDDFDQWMFQLWSHAVTEEFHLWVAKFKEESNSPDGGLLQMPERSESELQSKLGSKLDYIEGCQLNLKDDLASVNKNETIYPNFRFLWAERRKRCTVKLSILAAQHNMLSSMLLKRQGPIQVLFRGHVHQSPIVNPDEFVAALEESSSLAFQDVIFAHKLISFLNQKGAVFSPPFDEVDARRMFLMRKLYGSLVDLTLTDGQSVLIGDMLHIAQKNGILSSENVTALFLTLRLKSNIERRFVQLADVISDIYHDFAGRISFVATQLASVETALYRMKIAQDRGKKVALWAGLVKFGLSMIPIAGQVAAAGFDVAVQSTEAMSELFFSENSAEIADAFQNFISSAGQFAVDAYVIENGSKLPDSVKENIAAAKLGHVCMSADFRDRLPPAYRERLVSVAESSWGASIEEVEFDIHKIVESFKEETDARVFEIDENDLHESDVMIEVMRIEETNLLGNSEDISAEEVSNDEREVISREGRGIDSYGEESLMERIQSPIREEEDEMQRVERTLQAIRSLPVMPSAGEGDTQTNTEDLAEGQASEDAEVVRDFEEQLLQREQHQIDGERKMETVDSEEEVDIASEKQGVKEEKSSWLLQETGCNRKFITDLSATTNITASASDWKEAFNCALRESDTVESGKLFHDDAVKCACTVLCEDVDWLAMGYVEDAFLETDTDGSFRVDEEQFLAAVGKIVGEIESKRRAAMSTHWAQSFFRVAPPKTGLINTILAKYLLRNLGVDTEGLGKEVDAIMQKFAVDRKVNLGRFAQIWRSLPSTVISDHDT